MNAKELHECVSQWPKEARPKDVRFAGGQMLLRHDGDGEPGVHEFVMPDDHAIALHVASGLDYLIGEGYHSFIFDCGDTDVTAPSLSLYDDIKVHGKTTFDLIHAAIIATQGEKQ